jgi:formate dehydrogenase subunit beta
MSTAWILRTDGDALGAVRKLLADLWIASGANGMVVPVYRPGGAGIQPALLDRAEGLAGADPIAPLVPVNAARHVIAVDGERPEGRFCAVLRSCEARALRRLAEAGPFSLDRWLMIGVDCLASFPADEFAWRVEKAGTVEKLTRNTLRFARQGGIATYRYRHGCQMCTAPDPQDADLSIFLAGLPVKEHLLVKARDAATAGKLRLEQITSGPASPALLAQHEQTLTRLNQRRMGVQERNIAAIPADLPTDLDSLLAWIQNCAPCRKCLDACPIYLGELDRIVEGDAASLEPARQWLAACLACGMCEEACPRHLPLTAIKTAIAHVLLESPVVA